MNINLASIIALLAMAVLIDCTSQFSRINKVTTSNSKDKIISSKGTKRFMFKAFCVTLFDPTFQGQIKLKKPKKSKRKKGTALGALDSFSLGGGGTFGPVCGPNGCV